jgi:hypothetical protein
MTDQHKSLLRQYRVEMRDSMKASQAWWRTLIAADVDESVEAAEAEVRRRWPDGPASHPQMIGTIQKYLHLCDELNRAVGQDHAVDLNRFVIEGLDSDESGDVSEFTDALSYWPIGLDDHGELI